MTDIKKMNEELACEELIKILNELSDAQKIYLKGVAAGMNAERKTTKKQPIIVEQQAG